MNRNVYKTPLPVSNLDELCSRDSGVTLICRFERNDCSFTDGNCLALSDLIKFVRFFKILDRSVEWVNTMGIKLKRKFIVSFTSVLEYYSSSGTISPSAN